MASDKWAKAWRKGANAWARRVAVELTSEVCWRWEAILWDKGWRLPAGPARKIKTNEIKKREFKLELLQK
jgi:hypothetical protein